MDSSISSYNSCTKNWTFVYSKLVVITVLVSSHAGTGVATGMTIVLARAENLSSCTPSIAIYLKHERQFADHQS